MAICVFWSLGALFKVRDMGSGVSKRRSLDGALKYTEQECVIKKDSWGCPCTDRTSWERRQPAIIIKAVWRTPLEKLSGMSNTQEPKESKTTVLRGRSTSGMVDVLLEEARQALVSKDPLLKLCPQAATSTPPQPDHPFLTFLLWLPTP